MPRLPARRPPCRVEGMEPRRLLSYSTASDLTLIGQTSPADSFTQLGSALLFRGGGELWRTDGTPAGTGLLRDIHPTGDSNPRLFTVLNDVGYFFATDPVHGHELWQSDGTPEGTRLAVDITPGTASTNAQLMAAVNGRLYFSAPQTGSVDRAWVSDGTPGGTFQLIPGNSLSTAYTTDFFAFGGKTYFFASGAIFSTDGTQEGTRLAVPLSAGYDRHEPTVVGDRFVFHSTSPDGIYSSDGTPEGTQFIRTNPPGAAGPDVRTLYSRSFVRLGDKLMFVGFNAATGAEPWITDGTPEGTRPVADIRPGPESSMVLNTNINAPAEQVLPFGGGVFFSADDSVHGKELWFTDGTKSGTRLFADLVPGPGSLAPTMGATVSDAGGQTAFFSTSLGLLRTDGTPQRTAVVSTIKPLDRNRAVLDDKLVFGTVSRSIYAISARDDKPPAVTLTVKTFAGRGPFAEIEFTEDVSASATPAAFRLLNRDTGQTIDVQEVRKVGPTRIRVELARVLSEGNYLLEAIPGAIRDILGNPLSSAVRLEGHVLYGDVDNNRVVTDFDVYRFGQVFNTDQAWADFDGSGLVDMDDFALLCANFGRSLPPPQADGARSPAAVTSGWRVDREDAWMRPAADVV